MQSQITSTGETTAKIDVELPWETILPHYSKALKDIRKHAQVPGFRQGKAPEGLLKKRYREELSHDLARKVVPDSLENVVKEKGVKMVGQPMLSEFQLKDNEGFSFTVHVEVIPDFELKQWRGIEAETLDFKVEDDLVIRDLEHQCQHAAEDRPVEDRPVQDGDVVKASLTVIDAAQGTSLLDQNDYEVRLFDESVHPVLREMALGMSPGEYKEHEYEAGEDDQHPQWRNKRLKFFMELKSVAVRHQPELNDDFAKSKGFENLDAMREATRNRIEAQVREQERDRVMGVVLDKLAEAHPIQVPETLIVEEASNRLAQQMYPMRHLFKDQPLPRETMETLVRNMRPQSEQLVRLQLILDKLAESEGLEVSDEEIDAELKPALKEDPSETLESLREQFAKNGVLEEVKGQLLRRKAVDAVVEAANLKTVESLSSAQAEAAGEDELDAAVASAEAEGQPRVQEDEATAEEPRA